MTLSRLLVVLILGALAAPAAAQPSLGMGRRLGRPLTRAPEPEAPAEPASEPGAAWVGPQIQLGYGYLKLADGYGGGDAHLADLSIFVQTPVTELRLAVRGEVGARDYSLGGDDLLAIAGIEIGFQLTEWLEPLVPHISFVVSLGGLVGERFESTVIHGFGGAGLELGLALRLFRNLHLHAALGYQRWEMDGAAFDLFQIRLGAGL
ncbi:MAG: hypothetical protein EVA89_37940 [Sandaracinaceae bacterium]|nr:MAG: hypothetical protein EVA89_37940 [Sandaracinaceae bacterium]